VAGHYGKTTRLGAGGGHRNFLSTTHGTSRAERLGRVVPHPKSERRNRLVLSRRAGRLGHTLTQNLVDCAHFPPQRESSVFQDQALRPPERAGPYTRSHSATQPFSLSLIPPVPSAPPAVRCGFWLFVVVARRCFQLDRRHLPQAPSPHAADRHWQLPKRRRLDPRLADRAASGSYPGDDRRHSGLGRTSRHLNSKPLTTPVTVIGSAEPRDTR
jgi:hypothetical protein